MHTYADIEKKIRRALRNEGGTNIGNAEIKMLVELGLLELLSTAVNEEMKRKWHEKTAPISSETTGSTSETTARPPTSGRSRGTTPTNDAIGIEALVAGM
jgi:hypothetical protein